MLRAAAEAGRPFHVVHFDGHGAFLDASGLADEAVAVSSLTFGGRTRTGRHGYLLFEDPGMASNQRLVDGPTLADLLVETRVPVLVLNACRSERYVDEWIVSLADVTELLLRIRGLVGAGERAAARTLLPPERPIRSRRSLPRASGRRECSPREGGRQGALDVVVGRQAA